MLKGRTRDEYIELADASAELARTASSQSRSRSLRQHFFEGWRGTVGAGFCTALVVLAANSALLGYGLSRLETGDGIRTIYDGTCKQMRRYIVAYHIIVNILSTLLLGASNAAIQCLAAPTRAEVDIAHAKGDWVHIGVFGVRNLRVIPKKRTLLCLLLCLSSTPLHLIYNSTIFSKTSVWNSLAPVIYKRPSDAHKPINANDCIAC